MNPAAAIVNAGLTAVDPNSLRYIKWATVGQTILRESILSNSWSDYIRRINSV